MVGTFIGIWLAATLTIAIISFLYRDNPFYRIAENVYVGVSAAFGVLIFWNQDVWPLLIDRFRDQMAAGNPGEAWILVIPTLLGLLMWTQFFPKVAWVSRWSLAFVFGIGSGYAITGGIHGYILPQLRSTLLPLGNPAGALGFGHGMLLVIALTVLLQGLLFRHLLRHRYAWSLLASAGSAILLYLLFFEALRIGFLRTALSAVAADNLVIVVAVIGTLLYFFFSREHTGMIGVGSRIGIIAIMISFGASFGYTVMARVSLLIGRCYFLINDWIGRGIVEPLRSLFN